VASHIRVRELERSVTLRNRNREFPKHDFPIYPESMGSQVEKPRTGGIGDWELGT
jgi:hypothetical protein